MLMETRKDPWQRRTLTGAGWTKELRCDVCRDCASWSAHLAAWSLVKGKEAAELDYPKGRIETINEAG